MSDGEEETKNKGSTGKDLTSTSGNLGATPNVPIITMPHVSIPRFYKPDPAMYFINVESQFTLAGIVSDHDRYVQLTAKLEPEILAEVSDVVRNPNTRTYSALKKAILMRFGQSEEQRLNRLLGTMEMGDKTPSQILREIQRLADTGIPESIVRGIWLKKLPTYTQQILHAVSLTTPLAQQAEVADKVMAVSHPTSTISTVSNHDTSLIETRLDELSKKVQELSSSLETLLRRSTSEHSSRSHSRSRTRSPAAQHRYCYIHHKYKSEARHCAAPATCKFEADKKSENY